MRYYDAVRTRKFDRAAEHRGVSERWDSCAEISKEGNNGYVDRTYCWHIGKWEAIFGLRYRGLEHNGRDRLIVNRLRRRHQGRVSASKGQEATDVTGKSEAKLLRI